MIRTGPAYPHIALPAAASQQLLRSKMTSTKEKTDVICLLSNKVALKKKTCVLVYLDFDSFLFLPHFDITNDL